MRLWNPVRPRVQAHNGAAVLQLNTGQGVIKELRRRCSDESDSIASSRDEVVPRVLTGRCGDKAQALATPDLSTLSAPTTLPDIFATTDRLARAVANSESIGLVTDHDVDGVTSHAVLIEALTRWFGVPHEQIHSYIGHRLHDGYGLSDPVADRILADSPVPSVVITADCGSSDEPRIARLAEAGIDVIVTDHHELGYAEDTQGELVETPPPSAHSVINPTRADSSYDDPKICGAMVTWLTLCATRNRLIAAGGINPNAPSLGALLDYVALGTVADCVCLGTSRNNRAVVRHGLRLIERAGRPCWRAARVFTGKTSGLGAQDLAFGIGPRINARGRLADAMDGVHFLLSNTDEEAHQRANELDGINTERKAIERDLTEVAMIEAELAIEAGAKGLALWLAAGHPGVHGIVASRILARFGRPVICLSPHARDPALITGSARGPDGVHIRDIFERIHRTQPDLLAKFGGHAAAGGITIEAEHLAAFQNAFTTETAELDDQLLCSSIYTDGGIDPDLVDASCLDALAGLEPYGQGFAAPLFEADTRVLKARPVGADKTHLQLTLKAGNRAFKGIWFSAVNEEHPAPVRPGETVRLAFTPQFNEFNGRREIQWLVRGRIM